jgi:uncharacterized protein involved in cysteine biosynthesis
MTFIKGFIGYFSSFTKIGKYGLVGYVILSGIISLVIALLVYSTIWQFGDDLGRLIFGFYPFDFGRSVIESVLEWLTRIVLWTLCFFTFKYLSLIILSPIMSLVSSKIEKSLIGSSGAKFSFIGEIIRGIRFNIRNLTPNS